MFKREAGYSLVEITIALSIASLLFATAFIGQSRSRMKAQFTAAVEKAVDTIAAVQNEAFTGSDTGISPNGVFSNRVFFGKALKFTDNRIDVSVLEAEAKVGYITAVTPEKTVTLPFAAKFSENTYQRLIFVRSVRVPGAKEVWTAADDAGLNNGGTWTWLNYNLDLEINDGSGFNYACITVNNVNISKVYAQCA